MAESLRGPATAEVRAADYHVTFALLYVSKSILQLENLITVLALDSNLVNDVIEIPILLLRDELALALAALGAALVKPLLDAIAMEDLLAVAALHGAERDAQADGTDERVDETSVLLLNILFSEPIRLLQHVLD